MPTQIAGYAYLAEHRDIKAMEPKVIAEVKQVKKKELIGHVLAIPSSLMPEETILSHIMFALKHEGINLQILSQALPLVPKDEMMNLVNAAPSGKYVRAAAYLWEHFAEQTIEIDDSKIKGAYHPLYDPNCYITTDGIKNKRWRITCNALGTLDYCIEVRKTERLTTALAKDVLNQTKEFTDSLEPEMLRRTLSWAYLSETNDSFAIEKETPDSNKTQRFVNLLKQAHTMRKLDEDYLIDLQNATISNPYDMASSYRIEQNYLSNGPGAIGVTYVPPSPELCRILMQHWTDMTNNLPDDVDPLILGAIISFSFVFIHPFMDGNGRLSRFLFHHVLCQKGGLKNGLILPVSAVLKDKEREYLDTLTDYSEKARRFWDVKWIDHEKISTTFIGHEAIYRYWDGTACAELMAEASEEAMEQHIKKEVAHLSRYDALKRRMNREFDVSDGNLSKLVMLCLDQNGRLTNKRRSQYEYMVPADLFDAMEEAYQELFNATSEAEAEPTSD